jgi:Fe-S-cluster containining protein
MIIEATALDARREPKIRERASIIDEGGEIPPDQADWMLNRGNGCVFFSRDSEGRGVCEIYETRPLCCRLFDCDGDERAIEFRQQQSTADSQESSRCQ